MSDKDTVEGASQDTDFDAAFAEASEAKLPAGQPAEGDDAGEDGEPAAAPAAAAPDNGGADPAPAAAASSDNDPWAKADPALKALFDSERQARERAEQSDRSQRGRIAALQRKIEAPAPAAPAPQKKDGDQGGDDEGKPADPLAQLREDYPDVAGPLLDQIAALRSEIDGFKPSLTKADDDRVAAEYAVQFEALEKQHPDFATLAADKDFLGWVGAQPKKIQEAANSDDAREVSSALTLFKLEREAATKAADPPAAVPKPDARRQSQLDGGRAATSRPAPVAQGDPDDFEGAFAAASAKKERQRIANRR
jgi:hypothetical protein